MFSKITKLTPRCVKSDVFGVLPVRIFPHLDTPYSVQMRENTDQKISEYKHFHAVTYKVVFVNNAFIQVKVLFSSMAFNPLKELMMLETSLLSHGEIKMS